MASSAAVAAAAAAALPSPNFLFSCLFPDNFVYAASRLPGNLPFQQNCRFGSLAVCFSRRQNHWSSPSQHAKPLQRRKKKQFSPKNHGSEEDELDEDAFEALFKQLEEDLRIDDSSFDDIEGDISEEDLAKLEAELAEALGDDELQMSISSAEATGLDDNAEDDDDDEEEEDNISEEDLARLERELAEALGDDDDDEEDIGDSISEEDLDRLERDLAKALGDNDDDTEAGDENGDDNVDEGGNLGDLPLP